MGGYNKLIRDLLDGVEVCLGTDYNIHREGFKSVAEVVVYTDRETPYTPCIEYKHFEFGNQLVTYVTREYPVVWRLGEEAYYPVDDEKSQKLYAKYSRLAKNEKSGFLGTTG